MFQIVNLKIISADCTAISFSKLRSAGLNYHLPKLFFSLTLTVQGVSNKHCLLTYFIVSYRLLMIFMMHYYQQIKLRLGPQTWLISAASQKTQILELLQIVKTLW